MCDVSTFPDRNINVFILLFRLYLLLLIIVFLFHTAVYIFDYIIKYLYIKSKVNFFNKFLFKKLKKLKNRTKGLYKKRLSFKKDNLFNRIIWIHLLKMCSNISFCQMFKKMIDISVMKVNFSQHLFNLLLFFL